MSEEAYFDRKFNEDTRRRGFDHEVNQVTNITGQHEGCHWHKCDQPAVKRYELKEVGAPGHGWDVQLCIEHDSEENAWEIYRTNNE